MIAIPLEKLRVRGFVEEEFTDEELVDGWITTWEIINLFTNRNFEPMDLILNLDGIGTNELCLPAEVISISALYEPTLGDLVEDTDFVVYNRDVPDDRRDPKIMLLNNVFPKGYQNVKVTGRFGYIDPKSDSEEPPRPLYEVAMRILPLTFENILEGGEKDVEISGSKRNVRREATDRWSYTKFDRQGLENQLLDDPIVNGILLKYYKGNDIVSIDFV
jgi:hypothetical protein